MRIRAPGSILALALVGGCLTPTGTEPRLSDGPVEVELAVGDDRILDVDQLRVSFLEVLEDTRCPIDVVCPHAGNAAVQVGIGIGMGPSHPFVLNTTQEPRQAVWSGVRMTLLAVTPAPREGQTIPPDQYVIRLRLETAP